VDILVIVLVTIIATAGWLVFWGFRLWRKWMGLWAALTEFFDVLGELQRLVDMIGVEPTSAVVVRERPSVPTTRRRQ